MDIIAINQLEQRIALLEARETLLVLYARDYMSGRGWKCIDIGDGLEITDTTWPRYYDSGDSQAGPEPPMWIGTATIVRWADGWCATAKTPDGDIVSADKRADRDTCIRALLEALNR